MEALIMETPILIQHGSIMEAIMEASWKTKNNKNKKTLAKQFTINSSSHNIYVLGN